MLRPAEHHGQAEAARPLWRRRSLLLFAAGWTLLVGLALWWLSQGHGAPSVWIIREADPLRPVVTEKVQGFFKADLGFQRLYPWVLLSPYLALVVWCFPIERNRLRVNLPVNLATCAAFLSACYFFNGWTHTSLAQVTIVQSGPESARLQTNVMRMQVFREGDVHWLQEPFPGGPQLRLDGRLTNRPGPIHRSFTPPGPLPRPGALSLWPTLLDLLAYGAVVGLAHSVHFYRRLRERERRAWALESSLSQARLDALRAQLQPHFLFNSLNAVVALLRRDPRLAEATLLSLSELLRLALSHSDKQEIPLRQEMEFVHRYLEIQQTRFGGKLRVEQEVEPAALECLVPALLLQPLLENALRHGIEPADNSGLLRLAARRENGKLRLSVEDDGVGLAAGPSCSGPESRRGTGIGLTNLRARLESLYGPAQALVLAPRPQGGATVTVEIPCREMTASEPAAVAAPA